MAVKLYYMEISPFSRSVEILLRLLNVKHETINIDLFKGEHLKEDFLRINPRHKVPFLVDDDIGLGESRAIMSYLVDRYAKEDSLYPKNLIARAKVNEILYFDASDLVPNQFACISPKLFGLAKTHDASREEKYKVALEYLEQKVSGLEFVVDDKLTIADISLASSLSLPRALEYDLSGYKNLNKYVDNIYKNVPGFDELTESAIKKLNAFMKANQEKNQP